MNEFMEALIDCFCRTVRELRAANSANVTVFFAVSFVPVVGVVGAAEDYSQANSTKAAMKAAADATALMLAKTIAASSFSSTQISQKASDYFVAMLNRPKVQGVA